MALFFFAKNTRPLMQKCTKLLLGGIPMTKAEIRAEVAYLQARKNHIEELMKLDEEQLKRLRLERIRIDERIRELYKAASTDYNPKLQSVTLIVEEDLDLEKILREGIGGIMI